MAIEQQFEDVDRRADLVTPLVEALVEVRRVLRDHGDFAAADAARDRPLVLGIEIAEAADGTTSFRLPR